MFSFLEELEHMLAKEFVQERSADDAVVVLAADITLVLDSSVVEFLSHFLDEERGGFVGEIKQGIEVEVTVATMTMDRSSDVEFLEKLLYFHKELGKILRWDSHVLEKGGRTTVGVLEFRQTVASAAHLPEHFLLVLVGDYAGAGLWGADFLDDFVGWMLGDSLFV